MSTLQTQFDLSDIAETPPPSTPRRRPAPDLSDIAEPSPSWTLATGAPKVKDWYRQTFGTDLPITSFGQDAYHNGLNLDHRNSFDVPLSPSSREGQSLIKYLGEQGIPYRAITRADIDAGVKASGEHIHVGPESPGIGSSFLDLSDIAEGQQSPQAAALQQDEYGPVDTTPTTKVKTEPSTPPALKGFTFDPATFEGRQARDQYQSAERDPNARLVMDIELPKGKRDWSEVSGNELARIATARAAAQRGVPHEFIEGWMKEHGSELKYYDLQTGEERQPVDIIGTPSWDSERNTLRVKQESPLVMKLLDDYKASRGITTKTSEWATDPTRSAGEKFLDVVGPPLKAVGAVAAKGMEYAGRATTALDVAMTMRRPVTGLNISAPNPAMPAAVMQALKGEELPEEAKNPFEEAAGKAAGEKFGPKVETITRMAVGNLTSPTNLALLLLGETGAAGKTADALTRTKEFASAKGLGIAEGLSELRKPTLRPTGNAGEAIDTFSGRVFKNGSPTTVKIANGKRVYSPDIEFDFRSESTPFGTRRDYPQKVAPPRKDVLRSGETYDPFSGRIFKGNEPTLYRLEKGERIYDSGVPRIKGQGVEVEPQTGRVYRDGEPTPVRMVNGEKVYDPQPINTQPTALALEPFGTRRTPQTPAIKPQPDALREGETFDPHTGRIFRDGQPTLYKLDGAGGRTYGGNFSPTSETMRRPSALPRFEDIHTPEELSVMDTFALEREMKRATQRPAKGTTANRREALSEYVKQIENELSRRKEFIESKGVRFESLTPSDPLYEPYMREYYETHKGTGAETPETLKPLKTERRVESAESLRSDARQVQEGRNVGQGGEGESGQNLQREARSEPEASNARQGQVTESSAAQGNVAQSKPIVEAVAQAKAKAEKPNPRTGLTPTQTESLAGDLRRVKDELPPSVGTAEYYDFMEARGGKGVTIKVPDDGEFTVSTVEQANRLHQKITGKPIEGLPKAERVRTMPLPRKSTFVPAAEQVANTDVDAFIEAYGGERKAYDALSKVWRQIEENPEVLEHMGGDKQRLGGILNELKSRLNAKRSIAEVREPLKGDVYAQIEQHPAYAELKATVDRALSRTYGGKDKAAKAITEMTPEDYIEHTELNSKSTVTKKIEPLQSQILRDLDIPQRTNRTFRGQGIDWFKVEERVNALTGEPVSAGREGERGALGLNKPQKPLPPMSAAQQKVLANVGMNVEKPTLTQRLRAAVQKQSPLEFKTTAFDRLTAAAQDSLRPLMKAISQGKATGGAALLPEHDPEVLTRLVQGSRGKFEQILDTGPVNARNKSVKGVGGVDWLLEPFDHTSKATLENDMRDAVTLMVSERTIEKAKAIDARAATLKAGVKNQSKVARINAAALKEKSRISGIGGGTSDEAVANQVIRDLATDPARYAKAVEGAKRYRAWADATLKYWVEKGRLSQESYNQIKASNQYYTAFQRVMETGDLSAFEKGSGGRLGSASQPVKKFKGGTKEIDNPYTNLLKITHDMYREADRNEALRAFRDLIAPQAGETVQQRQFLNTVGRRLSNRDKTQGAITIYVNGEPERWKFEKGIEAALKNWGEVYDPNIITKALQIPAKITRYSVTHSPDFMVRNIIRDAVNRGVISETGSKPWDILKNVTKGEVEAFKLAGGDNAGYYFSDRIAYHKELGRRMAELSNDGKTIFDTLGGLKHSWDGFSEKGEQIGRMAEYQSAFRKAKGLGYDDYNASLYAASKARDLLDFAIGGTVVKEINRFIPFTNAAVQGLTRTLRGAIQHPKPFLVKWGAYVLTPALLTYGWNMASGAGEEYRNLPAYQRDFFWNFKVGPNKWLRIPKPFEMGVLASGVERLIDRLSGNEKALEGYSGSVARSTLPVDEGAMAGPFRAFLEAESNYDFFRDKEIVPKYEEGKALELRAGAKHASRIGQVVQQILSVDARKVDHVIQSLTGGLGRAVLTASDIGREDKNLQPAQALNAATGLFTSSPATSSVDVRKAFDLAEELGLSESAMMRPLRQLQASYFNAKTEVERDARAKALRKTASKLVKELEARRPQVKAKFDSKQKAKDEQSAELPAIP